MAPSISEKYLKCENALTFDPLLSLFLTFKTTWGNFPGTVITYGICRWLSVFFLSICLISRLDNQPLFGKRARAGREADQTRESGGNQAYLISEDNITSVTLMNLPWNMSWLNTLSLATRKPQPFEQMFGWHSRKIYHSHLGVPGEISDNKRQNSQLHETMKVCPSGRA